MTEICEECGVEFTDVDCSKCDFRAGHCTGQHDNNRCQQCCQQSFAELIVINPVANLLVESI